MALAFIPSFFSRWIELRLRHDFDRIWPVLTTYPVIERGLFDEPPIFLACQLGDIEGLESAFSDQGMTPFVVDEYGDSLLHVKDNVDLPFH